MRYLWIVFLAGCALTPIDYSNAPPADWPKLFEKVNYIPVNDLDKWCPGRTGNAQGCAIVKFNYSWCVIYLANKDPALLEHERAHCRGYDHVGDFNRSRNAWAQYKLRAAK
jgi:hypothetical protein